MQQRFRESCDDLSRCLDRFVREQGGKLEVLALRCAETLRGGGKLLLFGNGGSAALAQHLAAEFVNRLESERPAFAALALGCDAAVVTSVANDRDFQSIFARQIEALGCRGDLALALSTSGRSPNVVAGLQAARRGGLVTAAFLGRDGGSALDCADLPIVVNDDRTARIQEVHLFAAHLLCRAVEAELVPR